MTINDLLNHPLVLLLAVLVALLGSARITRLVTYDSYPPTIWLRIRWATLTKDGPWSKLAWCMWCASPWLTLPCIGWFFLTPLAPWLLWSWWLFWSWLSLAYVAAMIVDRDESPAE